MTLSTRIISPPRTQRGFNLLEVLIAIVVLSIGLVGLGLLELKGVQYTRDAYARTQAAIMAESLADRMRANPEAAADGLYVFAADEGDGGTFPSDPGQCCSPADIAAADQVDWWNAVIGNLANAQANVALNGNGHYSIGLQWSEEEATQSYTLTFVP
jgi:type IV pilus assembly protein PilV